MLVMSLTWFMSLYLAFQIVPEEYSIATIFVGLLLGFVAGWLYWSLAISKWRIWAFGNVDKRNWAELKNKAIHEKLIWPDNSVFIKTELRTEKQKELINKIQEGIPNQVQELTLDEIQDDESLPDTTNYYFAKSEVILNPILLIAFILGGIFLFTQNRDSNEGIEMNLKEFGFIKWSDTNSIEFDEENGVLTLDALKDGDLYNLTFNVGSFDMESREDMIRRINIYQKRNQIKNGI